MRADLTEFAKRLEENARARFHYHKDRWLLNRELADNAQLIAELGDVTLVWEKAT